MIDIEIIGAKAIERRLDGMITKIKELQHSDVADEFASWQTEDLHRKHAAVKRTHTGVRTVIRPHSKFEMQHRRRVAHRLVRKGRYIPRWSTRPILREQLLERLIERMAEMLHAKLNW